MTTAGRPKAAVILASVVIVLIAAAIGFETLVSSGTSGSGSDYAVAVVRDGETLASFDVSELRAIDMSRISVDGKTEEGPRLNAVLKAAGVDEFQQLTINGMGVRDDGTIVLRRDEVTDDVLLDIAVRGTVKIVGPDIVWADRVRDVTEIVVE